MLPLGHMALICTVTDKKHWQSFGHMACVGVCLRIAGDGMWPLIVTSQLSVRGWFECVFVSGVCSHTHAHTLLYVYKIVIFLQSACGDQIVVMCVCVCVLLCTGGMPVPEQSPVTEEGLLLTIRNGSTGHNMEADNTANNILASVKEQVMCFFRS